MTRPLFSVITASYNSGDKLAATSDSVYRQEASLEFLIVDGASKDESLPLARRLAAERPQTTRLISEPDKGVYDAMNKGIRAATGRYLCFFGAGDTIRPGALQSIAEQLPDHDRAMVYGDAWYYGRVYDGPFDYRKLVTANICHQAIFYGRELFDLVGEYDLRYRILADWELNLRCFADRRVVKQYVPVTVCDYEGGGMSEAVDHRYYEDKQRNLLRHFGLRRYLVLQTDRVKRKVRQVLRH